MFNDYEVQAVKFLKDTKTKMTITFLKNGLHFPDDDKPRDIYRVKLKNANGQYSFNFGQCLAYSGKLRKKPTAYEILACVTKYEPGTFEDFCGGYGYNNDSIKDNKVYKAVVKEYKNIYKLFSDNIDALQAIQ
jgi:hypothetical protein